MSKYYLPEAHEGINGFWKRRGMKPPTPVVLPSKKKGKNKRKPGRRVSVKAHTRGWPGTSGLNE